MTDAAIDAAIAREQREHQQSRRLPLLAPAGAAEITVSQAKPQTKTIRSEISAAEWAAMDKDQRFAVTSADETIAAIDAREGR